MGASAFLGGDGLAPVVKHLQHIVDVSAKTRPRSAATGTASSSPPTRSATPRGLPLLTDALLEAGFSEDAIGKILHGNVMRVLES